MEKSGISFIGMDVHKDTIDIAIATAGREGEVRHLGRLGATWPRSTKLRASSSLSATAYTSHMRRDHAVSFFIDTLRGRESR
jgi:hypothetical protein